MINISQVNIEMVKPNNGLVAFASVVIDNSIYLGSIAVYKKLNSEGYRLLYSQKAGFDVWHPINQQASSLIEAEIYKKLKEVMSKVYDRHDQNNNTL